MASLSVIPLRPVPNRACSLTFSTSGNANHAKVWATSAPAGSSVRAKIDASSEGMIPVYDGPSGPDFPIPFLPDRGGVYSFTVSDVAKGASDYGGSYDGDPASDLSEAAVGATSIVTLEVGERIEQKVGKSSDAATLSLWVWGDYILPTSVEVHGEVTPSIAKPTSSRAQVACESQDVLNAVAALAGLRVSDAVGDLKAVLADVVARVNSHMATQSPIHFHSDAANVLPPGISATTSSKELPKSVTTILASLRGHYTNDDVGHTAGVRPGPDSASYHDTGSGVRDDAANLPAVDSAGDVQEAMSALADAWRSYEAHRVSTIVHISPDLTNVLASLPPLLEVHRAYMDSVSSASPAVPPTMNGGVVMAVQQAGFRKT